MKIWPYEGTSYELVANNGDHVCNVHSEKYRAYIVKAVNSYEAMKEALTLLTLRIGCGCAELPCAMCRYAEEAAEKALALAEGKE